MKKKPAKPFNGGQWTIARMRSFAMSAIRRAQWPQKHAAIKRANSKAFSQFIQAALAAKP